MNTSNGIENAPYDYYGYSKSVSIRVLLWIDLVLSVGMTPLMIIFGLTGNIVTVIVLAKSPLGTTSTTRVYYIWIAIFDALTIAIKDVFFTFLTVGMHLILRGLDSLSAENTRQPQWYFTYASAKWYCIIVAFSYTVAEMVANISVIALILERLFVLSFPFKAPAYFTARRVLLVLIGLFFFANLLSLCTFFGANVVPTLWIPDWPLCGMAQIPVITNIETAQLLFVYFIPACAYVIVTVWTVFVLRKISAESKKLKGSQSSSSTSKKEMENFIIAIIMVISNVAIFLPIGATFLSLPLSAIIKPFDRNLVAYGTAVWQAFYPFAIFPHSINFIIYILKVRSFKESVEKLFTCQPLK